MNKLILTSLLLMALTGNALAQVNQTPRELQEVDVVDMLGSKVPMDLKFKDEYNQDVTIGKYFNQGKPVILVLAYYECPMLCTFVLNALSENITKIPNWKAGVQYQIVTVSINPLEKADLALEKKKNYLNTIQMPTDSNAWTFLIDPYNNAKQLADAVGFKYYYDKQQQDYAHPAVAFILTEDGVLSRNLFGLTYEPKDLKLSLLEASNGKIGNMIEKIILFCYHYDPEAKGYVLFAKNVMKIGGLLTILMLGSFLAFFWKMDLQRSKNAD
ncbi:MAG: SCO family protein [Proteobacteria bacterium]|nr:SCO family protein [Pseudomonadota bacterium]